MLKVKSRKAQANIRMILSYYGNPHYDIDINKRLSARTLREYRKYLIKEGLLIKKGRGFKTNDIEIFWGDCDKATKRAFKLQDVWQQQFDACEKKFGREFAKKQFKGKIQFEG